MSENEFSHLVSRDRWLLLEGFKNGYESGHHDTVESQYSDAEACGNDWLDDMAADSVTVEMVITKEAPPDYTLTATLAERDAEIERLKQLVCDTTAQRTAFFEQKQAAESALQSAQKENTELKESLALLGRSFTESEAKRHETQKETAREAEEMEAALEMLSGWVLTWPKSEVQKEIWDEANKHIDE